jgi:hypothetical protein
MIGYLLFIVPYKTEVMQEEEEVFHRQMKEAKQF